MMTVFDLALRHYDSGPLELDRSWAYAAGQRDKPDGFWVSVEGEQDWKSWCKQSGFYPRELQAEHVVTLGPGANILYLSTVAELDTFNKEYGLPNRDRHQYSFSVHEYVDWRGLTLDYDGLIIAPYQYSRRMKFGWYYGWDCASGCIWNLDAIESLTA
jgi:hypothetical protein